MSLNQVNVAVVENNTIVKSDVLRAEKAGTAVKIKAVKGGKYILAQGEKGYAPENITVKRVGKSLHVILEGTDENQPQLIIEDFFDNPGELVGKAEDGQWHEFISSDGDSDHQAAFLMDGESSALVLGAGTIGGLDGLAVAPFALSPALLALGALAGLVAAAGLATAIAHSRDKGGSDNENGGDGGGEGGGNSIVFTPELNSVADNVGDFTGPIQNGGLTDDSTPTFSGTGTPGNIVVIRDKGEEIGSAIIGEDGRWEFTPETPLDDGEHRFELVERDDKGNESVPGEEFVVIVDTEAPAKPDIGQVYDDAEPKIGPISNGGTTNDETPTFSGSNQTPGDTIIIIDNGKEIGSVIVGNDGSWEFTPDQPLENGEHSVEIVARDPAGNRSEPSDPWLVIIDTEIPGKPGTGTTPGIDDIIDDVGSVTGTIQDGATTDDTRPTLEGSHQKPGTIVTIIDNGTVIGSVVADKNGGWQFTPVTDLPEGDHQFSLIIETPNGYVSPESDPWLVIVDITAPGAPVITSIIDDQGAVTGPISDGDVTDDAQPVISGTAEANSTVIIYDNGTEIGRADVDASGNWSFTPVPPLLNGDHEITAKAQDAAGNVGDASNSIGFELISGGNATAPAIIGAWDDVEGHTGLLHNGDLTNDARPELRGTAQPGDVVTVVMDGRVQGSVTAGANGQWSWTPAADLSEGVHNFRAEVSDAAGNKTSTGNFSLELDLTPPDAADDLTAEDNVGPVTGTINPGDTTDDSTPTFGGTGEPGDKVIVKDGDDVIGTTIVKDDGSWEFTPENPLNDGEHSIIVIIEDPAGNQSDESTPIEFIVDTGNVLISIDYAVDDVVANTGNMASGTVTNDDTPTLHGKATPNSIVTIMDGSTVLGSVKTDSFGRWTFTTPSLAEGEHRFTATATDAKTGAISAPTAEFVLDIDTTAPTKPGEGGTGGDGIGDVIDDVGPIKGSVGNGDVTDDTTPTLEGSGLQPGDVVTIIDNGTPVGSAVADENGGWQFTPDTPLNDGDHEFTVIVTDPAGNSSEESDPYLVIVDTEAPAAPVITSIVDDQGSVTGPISDGGVTDDAQPVISGTAEANSTVIIYDNGTEIGRADVDASGNWSFTPVPPLLNGDHEITAKAQDAAGNVGDVSNSIGFELIAGGIPGAPAIIGAWDDVEGHTGMLHNGALTNDARPELRGTAPAGKVVTISVDGVVQGSVTADANGQWSWTPAADLTEGVHNFRAEITDTMGNTLRADFALELDLTPPDAADDLTAEDNVGDITGPIMDGDTTDDSTPTFGGTGEPGDKVIVKDGDDIIGTTIVKDDGSWEFTPENPLSDGEHSIIVIIEDPAGNQSDDSTPIEFIVDTGNVVVSIDYAVDDVAAITGNMASGAVTNDETPTLHGKATPNTIVTIMDGNTVLGSTQVDSFGRWSFTTPTLAEGVHDLTAKVSDAAGNTATTSEFSLEIDTTASINNGIGLVFDDVGVIQGPIANGGSTDDTTPTLIGDGQTPGDIITVVMDGEVIGSAVVDKNGDWAFTPDTPLTEGAHEFTTVVTDPAGNSSAESDPFNLVIDTMILVKPTITDVWDDQGSRTGTIAKGSTTDDNQPDLTGTSTANSLVIIYDNGIRIGSAMADASGNWSFTPSRPMANGTHLMTVVAQSAAGNQSEPSDGWNFSVSTGGAPGAPAIVSVYDNVDPLQGYLGKGQTTNDTRPTLAGTGNPGNIVFIYDGAGSTTPIASATVQPDGSWSVELPTALSEGSHDLWANARNAAGNISAPTGTWNIIVDTQAPAGVSDESLTDDVGAITGPINSGDTTDDSTPTFSGKAEPGAVVIIKDNGIEIGSVPVDANGDWSFTPAPALTDGSHSFTATPVDAAGNRGPESTAIDFDVDTSAVVVSIDSAVDDAGMYTGSLSSGSVTDDTTPTLVGRASANDVVFIYQNGGTTAIGSVTADANGNWNFTVPTLTEGDYTFQAGVDDGTGTEVRTNDFALIIDLTAPSKPLIDDVEDDVGKIKGTVANGGVTDDSTPTLSGRGVAGDLVTVRDGSVVIGSTLVRADGTWNFTPSATPLNDGLHHLSVIMTDPAGNSSQPSDDWVITVDTIAPNAPRIDSVYDNFGSKTGNIANGGKTDDQTPTLRGSAEANSIITIYDGNRVIGSTVTNAAGKWEFTTPSLPMNSNHQFTVLATDQAGNSSNKSSGYTVNIESDFTKGSENFTSVSSGTTFSAGNEVILASGLKITVQSGSSWLRTGTPWGNGLEVASGEVKIDFGGTDFIQVGNTTSNSPGNYIDVYSTTGNYLGREYFGWQQYGWSNRLVEFSAPTGQSIGYIIYHNGDREGTTLDNITWGTTSSNRLLANHGFEEEINNQNLEDTNLLNFNSAEKNDIPLLIEHQDKALNLNGITNYGDTSDANQLDNMNKNILNVNLDDLLDHAKMNMFIEDGNEQLMINGDTGDVVNLTDLLPDGTDLGNWSKADGTVTVDGVQYEVYQHSGADTELLVQLGVQTNLNNH